MRHRCHAPVAARRDGMLRMLRGTGADVLELDTALPYLPALLRFFRRRAARMR